LRLSWRGLGRAVSVVGCLAWLVLLAVALCLII
jgi:hypothetical protein